jgi:hypothetical protein
MPQRDLARLSRAAAVSLTLSVALVLGVCCLFLWQTVWTGTPPAKAEPYYTELPGVDLTVLPPEKKEALLKRLNRQRCPCDCMRTVASCRNHHGSCSMSLVEARQAVEAARKH